MMGGNELRVEKGLCWGMEVENWMSLNYGFDIKGWKVNEVGIKELVDEYGVKRKIRELRVNGDKIEYIDGYKEVGDCVGEMWKQGMKQENEWEGCQWKEWSQNGIGKEVIKGWMGGKDDYVKECMRKDGYNEDEVGGRFYQEMMIQGFV